MWKREYPILDTRISVCPFVCHAQTTPPDFEMGWTEELWSKTNLLKKQKKEENVTRKRASSKVIQFSLSNFIFSLFHNKFEFSCSECIPVRSVVLKFCL